MRIRGVRRSRILCLLLSARPLYFLPELIDDPDVDPTLLTRWPCLRVPHLSSVEWLLPRSRIRAARRRWGNCPHGMYARVWSASVRSASGYWPVSVPPRLISFLGDEPTPRGGRLWGGHGATSDNCYYGFSRRGTETRASRMIMTNPRCIALVTHGSNRINKWLYYFDGQGRRPRQFARFVIIGASRRETGLRCSAPRIRAWPAACSPLHGAFSRQRGSGLYLRFTAIRGTYRLGLDHGDHASLATLFLGGFCYESPK